MSRFFKRYRRNTVVKALKAAEPVFTIETSELMSALASGLK
jgi:hypothetical protein